MVARVGMKAYLTYRESLAEGREKPSLSKSSTFTSTFDVVESPSDAFDQEEQGLELDDRTTQKIGTAATSASLFPASNMPAPELSTSVVVRQREYVAYNTYDPCQVIGKIMVGPDRIDQGTVRFRGFELSAKRLLIGIKSAPRHLFVWFKHSIVAEDYRVCFHTV